MLIKTVRQRLFDLDQDLERFARKKREAEFHAVLTALETWEFEECCVAECSCAWRVRAGISLLSLEFG